MSEAREYMRVWQQAVGAMWRRSPLARDPAANGYGRFYKLIEEAAEAAAEIKATLGAGTAEEAEERRRLLAGELGDVLFVLMTTANEHGIDVAAALEAAMEKFEKRYIF